MIPTLVELCVYSVAGPLLPDLTKTCLSMEQSGNMYAETADRVQELQKSGDVHVRAAADLLDFFIENCWRPSAKGPEDSPPYTPCSPAYEPPLDALMWPDEDDVTTYADVKDAKEFCDQWQHSAIRNYEQILRSCTNKRRKLNCASS